MKITWLGQAGLLFETDDLKIMIYVSILFVFISAFVKYKPLKVKDYEVE